MTMNDNKKRILHVEDDIDLQGYVSTVIGSEAEITNTSSFKEAYELLHKEKFDLILLDLTLPDGSGLDLLNTLGDIGDEIPPVVIFSSHEVTDSLPYVKEVLVKGRYNEKSLLDTLHLL